MSSKINSGNTTNDQGRLAVPEAALLDNVNTRAKAVLECVEKLRDLNALSVDASQEKANAKAKKAARFLNKVERLVTRLQDAANDGSYLIVAKEDYQQCQKDLKSLRRLAASSYARGVGYAALRLLVLPFVSLVTVAIGLAYVFTGKSVRETIDRKYDNRVPLNFAEKTVDKTFRTYDKLKFKRNQSVKIASGIGFFRGVRHQAKKAIEEGYQPETPTKKTK